MLSGRGDQLFEMDRKERVLSSVSQAMRDGLPKTLPQIEVPSSLRGTLADAVREQPSSPPTRGPESPFAFANIIVRNKLAWFVSLLSERLVFFSHGRVA